MVKQHYPSLWEDMGHPLPDSTCYKHDQRERAMMSAFVIMEHKSKSYFFNFHEYDNSVVNLYAVARQ